MCSDAFTTPANRNLFELDEKPEKLNQDKSDIFHSVVAKLLWVMKRGYPDIELAVSFLWTRVKYPNENDWFKLKRLLQFQHGTIKNERNIGSDNLLSLLMFIDVSYAVHDNIWRHTGGLMTFGCGVLHECQGI